LVALSLFLPPPKLAARSMTTKLLSMLKIRKKIRSLPFIPVPVADHSPIPMQLHTTKWFDKAVKYLLSISNSKM
jgi:hypothetical protein